MKSLKSFPIFTCITLTIVTFLGSAVPVSSQTPVTGGLGNGRAYNIRRLDNANGTWTGVTTTFNNGTSNLSTPTPNSSSSINISQASFNTWVQMSASNQPLCYAEVVLLKRRYKNNALPGYDGRVFAHTTYNASGQDVQVQNIGTSGNFTQGGFVGNITIGSGGNLQLSGGGATLTVPNFQCLRLGSQGYVTVNPTGFYSVDRGFEGNTTASVWTNGASMGKTMERVGAGNYQTSSGHYAPPGVSPYPSWSTSYNPNDNQGTIIMFR